MVPKWILLFTANSVSAQPSYINLVPVTQDLFLMVAGQPEAPPVQDQARQVQRVGTAAQFLPDQSLVGRRHHLAREPVEHQPILERIPARQHDLHVQVLLHRSGELVHSTLNDQVNLKPEVEQEELFRPSLRYFSNLPIKI